MVIKVDVSVDYTNARRLFREAEHLFENGGSKSTLVSGQMGKQYARAIAPNDEGILYRAINFDRNSKTESTVFVEMDEVKANRRWPGAGKFPNFDLVRWMHETGGVFQSNNPYGPAGTKHIWSGEPRFMYKTAEYLRKFFPDTVAEEVDRVVTKINK